MSDELKKDTTQTGASAEDHKVLSKHDLHRAAVRWCFMACNAFNYETQEAPGLTWSLAPALRKIYPNDDDYEKAIANHLNYFNTTTAMANVVMGATTAMEEREGTKSIEAVQSLKTSLMGPLAGIGDTLIWVLWPTIMGSISGYMAVKGNPLGAIIWFLCNLAFFFVKIKLTDVGYFSGTKLITSLGDRISIFTESASIMGLTVVGALIASVVRIQSPINFQFGAVKMALQSGILDKIMPSLLSVLLTVLVYKLIGSKKWTMNRIILFLIALSMVCSFFGILK
jgi:Phosphotransferase system, mannose/fructose/N-acetylgalactosamine-specific component IID